MLIAYQGETGAYSEAAGAKFDPSATFLPCPAFEDVFAAVETGRATGGVLPIENSIGGTIHRNYDLLVQNALPIVGEVELPVRHLLLALPGTRFEDLKQIYSHPQALAQCDRFLRSLTGVEIVASYDTAGSAKMIREQQMAGVGAIASERAAAVFGLETLRSDILDYADNTTRFIIVTRAADAAEVIGDRAVNKTTIVFTLPNTPGALFKGLSVFALRDIDITKIESRPTGRPWEYLFHLDLAVGQHDLRCGRALSHLAEFAPSLKVLGSYPGVDRSAGAAVAQPGCQDARVAGGLS
ncbi:MAG: prephenate dehydratase [Vicinamibacteraceae bacterium]